MARMQVIFSLDDEGKDATMKSIATACREIADSTDGVFKCDPREIIPQKTKTL